MRHKSSEELVEIVFAKLPRRKPYANSSSSVTAQKSSPKIDGFDVTVDPGRHLTQVGWEAYHLGPVALSFLM